ncbi:hypothetical protein [Microbispora sp. CA-102843]|uniref:hypothetical protein n=1 Tax=Microbispora sp. CA-102843 TaxID=3239952 RepID=UPI003D8C8BD4
MTLRDLLAALRRDDDTLQLLRERDEAQAHAADLQAENTRLREDLAERTKERDQLATDLAGARAQLAAARLTRQAETTASPQARRYTERAVEAPPPPRSIHGEELRERERADTLARLLAAAERELHAIKYPRVNWTAGV